MPKAARHPILYDVERWRRYRVWLLLPSAAFTVTAVLLGTLQPASRGAFGYSLVAACLAAIATSLWIRQRFTYLCRKEDQLVIRTMATTRRLSAVDIDRPRLIRLSAVYGRPDRRRKLPRPVDRWLAADAISIKLRDSVDVRALRRIVGPRCIVDGSLVVPLADAPGLLAEVTTFVCPPKQAIAASGRRRGRRR